MSLWAQGSRWEQRAAVVALCEPRLLAKPARAQAVLDLLDCVTASLMEGDDRKSAAFRTLRKSPEYCWSVAAAARPEAGRCFMERWLVNPDPGVRWVIRKNLKKARLRRVDTA